MLLHRRSGRDQDHRGSSWAALSLVAGERVRFDSDAGRIRHREVDE